MVIWIYGWYLSFKVDVMFVYCYNFIGLFGFCDNEFDNDFKVCFNGSIILVNVI